MNLTLHEVTFLDSSEAILIVKRQRWFGLMPPEILAFRGSGTVWHRYPEGHRAGTGYETRLSDIYTAAQWKRQARKETET